MIKSGLSGKKALSSYLFVFTLVYPDRVYQTPVYSDYQVYQDYRAFGFPGTKINKCIVIKYMIGLMLLASGVVTMSCSYLCTA